MEAAIIGLGRFGWALAEALIEDGHEVIIIDIDEDLVQKFEDRAREALVGDATNEQLLRTIGPDDLDAIVVAIGDDVEASVLTCMTLMDLGARLVIAKAEDSKHAKILERIGVHKVVFPEQESARHVADLITHPKLVDKIDIHETHTILDIRPSAGFVGKTLRELNLRASCNLLVLGIKRRPAAGGGGGTAAQEFLAPPSPEERLMADDILTIMCHKENIPHIEKW